MADLAVVDLLRDTGKLEDQIAAMVAADTLTGTDYFENTEDVIFLIYNGTSGPGAPDVTTFEGELVGKVGVDHSMVVTTAPGELSIVPVLSQTDFNVRTGANKGKVEFTHSATPLVKYMAVRIR